VVHGDATSRLCLVRNCSIGQPQFGTRSGSVRPDNLLSSSTGLFGEPCVQVCDSVQIVQASEVDLERVMQLFADARAWHLQKGVDVWSEFDQRQIASDIRDGRVFVAKAGMAVLGAVTLVESDPLVWGPEETEAIYIHKLASSRDRAVRGVGTLLLQWVQEFARKRGKKCVRLDTWNGNRGMRTYYERNGFRHVIDKFFPLDSPLPSDYRGTYKSLYELRLD
jgi:GNAT superfamily N-acetyltransferase